MAESKGYYCLLSFSSPHDPGGPSGSGKAHGNLDEAVFHLGLVSRTHLSQVASYQVFCESYGEGKF